MIRHVDFPRRKARTRSFTLGRPRTLTVSPDGERVLFLRSPDGESATHALWLLDVTSGTERLVARPERLVGDEDDVPEEELRRRERAREQSSGIVTYATDRDVRRAVFVLSGRIFVTDVEDGTTIEIDTAGPAFDPRLDPAGQRVAYVSSGDLHVAHVAGGGHRVAGDHDPDVTWGLAEFVAAEEMGRLRGHWWSPDGRHLVAARVDASTVDTWHIGDPAHPDRTPTEIGYPAAGRTNADVTLAVFDLEAGEAARPTVLSWDQATYPYLGRVVWQEGHPLTLEVVTRRQEATAILTADVTSGATEVVAERRDDDWVELLHGSPRWLADGRLLLLDDVVADDDPDGTRRIVLDGEPATPAGLMVTQVVSVGQDRVWFLATDDPQQLHVHTLDLTTGRVERLTDAPGWHGVAVGGDTAVVGGQTLDESADQVTVQRGGARPHRITSHAHASGLDVDATFLELGPRRAPAALLLPHDRGDGPWPVLLSPYGGPHAAARSRRTALGLVERRWLADQGYAVLVVDGRGTPNRSRSWERSVRYDLATGVLQDQVDALHAAADQDDRLDLSRVAIRGWSFGGFLAALAVLRRPDVFHAAVVGAPVTDWHLYDTFYTERYLGLPHEQPQAYHVSSLVDVHGALVDPVEPPDGFPSPGMLLIHGLADDNVVAAHTLRLSGALLAAGRPHEVLPLTGVTHMTPQEVVAENLLRLEIDFLRRHLQAGRPSAR